MRRSEIITHRGLEPSNPNFYSESSFEAFENHLNRGFGIEFDVNFTKDGIVIAHDSNLTRITNGKDQRFLSQLSTEKAIQIPLGNGRLCTLDELLNLIEKSQSAINALHLKGKYQDNEHLARLVDKLIKHPRVLDRILIFDVKPETARDLKQKIPKLHFAPSVSHLFDIKRFKQKVFGTLISVEDAIRYKQEDLFDWVWLDEWDRTDQNGKDKTLYNQKVFDKLRTVGYKIALVTPELHGASPGLLGGEAHPDAATNEKLFARIKEIISLQPDVICTDYPEEAVKLLFVVLDEEF